MLQLEICSSMIQHCTWVQSVYISFIDMRYEFSNSDWRFSINKHKNNKKEKNNCDSEHVYLL